MPGNAAVFLWWFSLAAFDDDFRLDRLKLGFGAAWFIIFLVDRGFLKTRLAGVEPSWILVGLGLAMVGHVAYRLLRDIDDDLIEARRRARPLLAAVLTALLLVDLGVDVVLGLDWKPHWFTIAQNAAILLVGAQACRWLLRADVGALTFGQSVTSAIAPATAPSPPAPAVASTPEARLLCRLTELMDVERVYRNPDLAFTVFVALMGAPEAQVRRLVNRQLGHRHFRGLLNEYRVAEARRILADPACANQKMVAIGARKVLNAERSENLFTGVFLGGGRATAWTQGRGAKGYRKPITVLIGPRTGSAGEALAWGMKLLTPARLIGRTSAGALLSSESFDLANGWSVTLPNYGLWGPDGISYADRPVTPHEPVATTRADLCAARDPDMIAALRYHDAKD